MVSGDHVAAAAATARAVGIDDVIAGVPPDGKVREVARRAAAGDRVAFVGDGLNDIIFGRSDVSTLDTLVRDWRAGGGDTIRGEYEAALQAAKGG